MMKKIFIMSQYSPLMMMKKSKKMREVRKYNKSLAPRLRWSPQLHDLFIQSVKNLGGGNKATPKRIMQMMAIKGLKISHVKSHLQMYRNMRAHPSLHVVMPDFNLSSSLHVSKKLRENTSKSSKEKESGSQNGENIPYNDYQEAEGSTISGMTKVEEEEDNAGEIYELPKADYDCEKGINVWPNLDDYQKYSNFNNGSSRFFYSTRETSTYINLDLSLS
ncbi:myb family transcription factor MPH1 [Capsicum chacoense]